jgi:sulfate permease, SulP family
VGCEALAGLIGQNKEVSVKAFAPGLSAMLAEGRADRVADLIAGVITGLVLVPQALAFAQLAGLPPEVGLAASMLPMLVYALLGSSRTLSVGPVSVAALMLAEVLQRFPGQQSVVVSLLAAQAALFLVFLIGLRLEVATRVFSHPVLSAFTVAAALLIVWSQLKPLLGLSLPGPKPLVGSLQTVGEVLSAAWNSPTLVGGIIAVLMLFIYGQFIGPWLQRVSLSRVGATGALLISRMGPLLLLALSALLFVFPLANTSPRWAVVGAVPSNALKLDASWIAAVSPDLFLAVLPSAIMIALVSYVESFAVAQSLAQKRREDINVRQEIFALSAANGVAAFCGAMPVAGGFSRSMVNFSAGARTQFSSVVAACLSFLILLLAGGVFNSVPKFSLAAIIIVAVIPLISIAEPLRLWRTDRSEAYVWICTFIGVFILGLELGLLLGAALGVLIYLSGSLSPHIAVMGKVPGTEHYRNIARHEVTTFPGIMLLRFDDSLTFLNAPGLKASVLKLVQSSPDLRQVVLSGAAINHVDSSGALALQEIAEDLKEAGLGFHLAEIKGPVSDYFDTTEFELKFPGQIFLSIESAVAHLVNASSPTERLSSP